MFRHPCASPRILYSRLYCHKVRTRPCPLFDECFRILFQLRGNSLQQLFLFIYYSLLSMSPALTGTCCRAHVAENYSCKCNAWRECKLS